MNPFTPTFGISPPELVGRDEDLADFALGLQGGAGAPERATLLTGLRGTGKTVMLNAYEHQAGTAGWLAVAETATPGMLERLETTTLPRLLREHADGRTATVTGASASAFGVGLGVEREVHPDHPEPRPALRDQLTALCDVLEPRGSGVLLTVDEVHRSAAGELRALSATIQHLFREERDVALVCAGLPSAVSDLLNTDVLTFLRRADRRHLTTVSRDDVARGLRMPIEAAGRSIEDDALEVAVQGTGGYPYLIQLVGLHTWRAAGAHETIQTLHAREGVRRARHKIGQLVHAVALADLSAVDRSFLAAMAVDDGPSRMADIAARLDVDAVYAGQYRLRLISAEMIEPRGRGIVAFTLPGLRDYLREHAVPSPWTELE